MQIFIFLSSIFLSAVFVCRLQVLNQTPSPLASEVAHFDGE